MYERFFGLQERPFDLVPNPRYLFLSTRQREAFSNLRYGLTASRGMTLLLGDAGTGKTTLLQSVLSDLDRGTVECVLISNPTLSRAEFYQHLTAGFGLAPGAGASKTQFLFELRRHLEARQSAGQVSAIVLDEAQSVPYELLEEVRLLGNMETQTAKLLNVILAGQPELGARLNEAELRQLKQRIGLRCELTAFDLPETAAYIAGRLKIAGGEPAGIFTRDAILAIHDAASGVPRTVNVVCDNALMGGYAAQAKPVTRLIVEEVCRDFDLRSRADASVPAPVLRMPTRHGGEISSGAAPRPADQPPAAPETGRKANEDVDRKRRFSFF
jgi:general secretion pathway protein A